MERKSKEARIQLAVNAFKKGQFKTIKAAALAFDISKSTLGRRIQGTSSRAQKTANCQKLSETEESTLSSWILDMDRRGLPLQLSTVHHLAQYLLSARLNTPSNSITIGGHWVNHYIQHHPELKSKYTRKYDYQRAKCEDPKIIREWFNLVQITIMQYGCHAAQIIVNEPIFKLLCSYQQENQA